MLTFQLFYQHLNLDVDILGKDDDGEHCVLRAHFENCESYRILQPALSHNTFVSNAGRLTKLEVSEWLTETRAGYCPPSPVPIQMFHWGIYFDSLGSFEAICKHAETRERPQQLRETVFEMYNRILAHSQVSSHE